MRHSLNLSDWGPYTKKYVGISHIPDEAAGCRFDLSVFPGFYRRKIELPNVNWECGYHRWEAAPDLSYFSFRHELEWKDQVYCDISYAAIDDSSRLVRSHCVNASDQPQLLVLHYLASMNFPPPGPYTSKALRPYRVQLPAGAMWIAAVDYLDMSFAQPRPKDNLVTDGMFRGESCGDGFTGPSGLGCGFGRDAGDAVSYRLSFGAAMPATTLLVRYHMPEGGQVRFAITGDCTGSSSLAGDKTFTTATCALGAMSAGEHTLRLTSAGGRPVDIDGLVVCPSERVGQVTFEPVIFQPRPQRIAGPSADTLVLKYPDVDRHYGMAWRCDSFEVREFHDSDLDRLMRHFVHDHVRNYFGGDELEHYTNVFFRPPSSPRPAQGCC